MKKKEIVRQTRELFNSTLVTARLFGGLERVRAANRGTPTFALEMTYCAANHAVTGLSAIVRHANVCLASGTLALAMRVS